MIKIRVISPGKDKDRWLTEGIEHYLKLLSRYASVEFVYLPSPRLPASSPPEEIMKKEAAHFEKELKGGLVVALSERGEKFNSVAFSKFLEKIQVESRGPISFLIGGAFGLHPGLLDRADHIVSLSDLTFSHQLVRLILAEQMYRGFSILHGTAYHK
ncbi:MAG: 23S rRNA (pseudouridine(1915)-N(3))-methyltransferase RlmH [Candidatus Zixiibacteriota bacterium]